MEERLSKECLEEHLCSESVLKGSELFLCLEALSKSSKEFRKEFRKVPYVPGGTL